MKKNSEKNYIDCHYLVTARDMIYHKENETQTAISIGYRVVLSPFLKNCKIRGS
jgi:hypothetical protein